MRLPHEHLQALEQDRPDRTLRPAYRVALLDAALAPLATELGEDRLDLLKHGLGLLTGTEALFAARDVLRLDHDTAREHARWACRLLVRAARAEAAGESARR